MRVNPTTREQSRHTDFSPRIVAKTQTHSAAMPVSQPWHLKTVDTRADDPPSAHPHLRLSLKRQNPPQRTTKGILCAKNLRIRRPTHLQTQDPPLDRSKSRTGSRCVCCSEKRERCKSDVVVGDQARLDCRFDCYRRLDELYQGLSLSDVL